MPFLGDALRLHLTRFPSMQNGLNRIEHSSLELISNGTSSFKTLFPAFINANPAYGMGDSQFWCALKRLGKARLDLIRSMASVMASNSNRAGFTMRPLR